MLNFFSLLPAYLQRRRAVKAAAREVLLLEESITKLTQSYRYDIEGDFARMNIMVVADPTPEPGVVLAFVPLARMVRLNPQATRQDQRMSLAMLLVHMASTMRGTHFSKTQPYLVYGADLINLEGPEGNQTFNEYMQAIDCIAPMDVVIALMSAHPQRAAYVIQRVLDISAVAYQQRMLDMQNNTSPVVNPELERDFAHLFEPTKVKATLS